MDIEQCLYVGIVTSYGETPGTVRVSRPDHEDRVSAEIQVLQRFTKENKEWIMPAIGEQVLVIQLPNAGRQGASDGYVIGGVYNESDQPVESEPKVINLKHNDGCYIRFDGEGNIELHASGDIKITVGGQVKVDKG